MNACAVDTFLTQIADLTRAQCARFLALLTAAVNPEILLRAAIGVFNT